MAQQVHLAHQPHLSNTSLQSSPPIDTAEIRWCKVSCQVVRWWGDEVVRWSGDPSISAPSKSADSSERWLQWRISRITELANRVCQGDHRWPLLWRHWWRHWSRFMVYDHISQLTSHLHCKQSCNMFMASIFNINISCEDISGGQGGGLEGACTWAGGHWPDDHHTSQLPFALSVIIFHVEFSLPGQCLPEFLWNLFHSNLVLNLSRRSPSCNAGLSSRISMCLRPSMIINGFSPSV